MKNSMAYLGKDVPFRRIRRITGYLSEASSFNDGKRAELHDRVKHASVEPISVQDICDKSGNV